MNDDDLQTVLQKGRPDQIPAQGGGGPTQLEKSRYEWETGKTPKEDRAAYWRWWYHNNKVSYAERHSEYQILWRKRHPGYYKTYLRARYAENPERGKAYQIAYRLRHPDRYRASVKRKYRELWADPVRRANHMAHLQRRDALKRSTATEDAKYQITRLLSTKTALCFYCHQRFRTRRMHIEHIKPLKKGGPHSAYNIVLACRKCNERKQAQDVNRFIRSGQMLLTY